MPDLPKANVIQLTDKKRLPQWLQEEVAAAARIDPILLLIHLQGAANEAYETAVEAHAYSACGDKSCYAAAGKFFEAAEDFRALTMKRLCSTKPTTLAGIAALAEFVGKDYECNFADKRTQKIFKTLAAACRDLDK